MKLKLLMIFVAAIFSLNSIAQTSGNQSDKDLASHEHPNNEIGIAVAPAYFINEKVWTFAMHIHYTRIIPKTKFGIGASFEIKYEAFSDIDFCLMKCFQIFPLPIFNKKKDWEINFSAQKMYLLYFILQ